MSVLLLILILIVLWPLLRGVYTLYKLRSQTRDFFNSASRPGGSPFSGGYGDYDAPRERPAGWSRPPPPRPKIFTREVGEYVEFEELEGKFTDPASGAPDSKSYRYESHITDAEWEDIK